MYVYTVPMHSQTLHRRPIQFTSASDAYVKFVSASAPCTHALIPEKKRLIL